MDGWMVADDLFRGALLTPSAPGFGPLGPRYRGAFEVGEKAPRRVRAAGRMERGRPDAFPGATGAVPGAGRSDAPGATDSLGAAVRLRSVREPFSAGRRSFGVSILVAPEIWEPFGVREGWHLFRSGEVLLGLWSSLPATWLAQDSSGAVLPPPWRELWTFGTDHLWICRIGRAGGGSRPGRPAGCAEREPCGRRDARAAAGMPSGGSGAGRPDAEAAFAEECRLLRYPEDFGPERPQTVRTAGIAEPT